jgi:hypothetical protein
MDQDRCPYCVEGLHQKEMTSIGRYYLICPKCCHMVIPDRPKFICSCQKCRKLVSSVREARRSKHEANPARS